MTGILCCHARCDDSCVLTAYRIRHSIYSAPMGICLSVPFRSDTRSGRFGVPLCPVYAASRIQLASLTIGPRDVAITTFDA